ncbi:MAG: bile acid:sodium symporter [Myxococcota bacterium]
MSSVNELAQWVGPVVLFLLMTAVGLELVPDDFRRLRKSPGAVVGGTAAQLIGLPLLTWGVVVLLDLPPIFGAGAVLVAVAPGAGISNVFVAAAGANTALSVTLTAFASALAAFSLPTFASLGLEVFMGESVDVDVPVLQLIAQLFFTLLVPLGLGMFLRARWPEFVARRGRLLQASALIVIVGLTALGVAYGESDGLDFDDAQAGVLGAAVWTLAAMALGWTVAWLLGLESRDRFTFLIEFSTRNIGVAGIVALAGLARVDLALFMGAYVVTGYPIAAGAVLLRRIWWANT